MAEAKYQIAKYNYQTPMSLRTKLLLTLTLSIAASVGAVAWLIEARTRDSFREVDQERTNTLVEQFRKQFDREGQEITRGIDAIASSETVLQMALALAGGSDAASYINAAGPYASAQNLDFLDLLGPDGSIISSAHWPARFGYKQRWFLNQPDSIPRQTFLRQVETPDGNVLGILCIRTISARGLTFYAVGGRKLDSALLQSLSTPAGMRVLIYSAPEQGTGTFLSSTTESFDPQKLMPLVQQALVQSNGSSATVTWNTGPQEVFHALTLPGFNERPAAVLLVGNSLQQQAALEAHIQKVSLIIALCGVIFGVIVSTVIASRMTHPLKELAGAATQIGAGDWAVRVQPELQR